jgi:hypothetical protein
MLSVLLEADTACPIASAYSPPQNLKLASPDFVPLRSIWWLLHRALVRHNLPQLAANCHQDLNGGTTCCERDKQALLALLVFSNGAEAATNFYILGLKTTMAGVTPPPGIYLTDINYFYAGGATGEAAVGITLRRLANPNLPPRQFTLKAD